MSPQTRSGTWDLCLIREVHLMADLHFHCLTDRLEVLSPSAWDRYLKERSLNLKDRLGALSPSAWDRYLKERSLNLKDRLGTLSPSAWVQIQKERSPNLKDRYQTQKDRYRNQKVGIQKERHH